MEIEFHLAKLYVRPDKSWRFVILEIQRFDTVANWTLFELGWEQGFHLVFWS